LSFGLVYLNGQPDAGGQSEVTRAAAASSFSQSFKRPGLRARAARALFDRLRRLPFVCGETTFIRQ
jgi:hypothetical protein